MPAILKYSCLFIVLVLPVAREAGAADRERPQRPSPDQMTYFDAAYWAQRDWKEGRPVGNSYADARKAFAVNSYFASKEVGRFVITEEQKFELAKIAARNHGAVMSQLITNFHLKNERDRYAVAMIAAKTNTWGNVEFDVDAFRLSDPKLRLIVIKTATSRSSYQIQFLEKWNLTRRDRYLLFKEIARKHGLAFLRQRELIPDLQEEELKTLLILACERNGYDVASNFKPEWLPRESDRIELAKVIAPRLSYFPEYLPHFAIKSSEALREISQLMLHAPNSKLLRHPQNVSMTDEQLLNTYFLLRERDDRSVALDPDRTSFFEMHDPIFLIEKAGNIRFPEFMRPGFTRPQWVRLKITEPGPEGGVVIYDSETEYLFADDPPSQKEAVEAFAKNHPRLLPPEWVAVVYENNNDDALASELLRQCYRLSDENHMFMPSNSIEIAFEAVGISGHLSEAPYDRRSRRQLLVELLSLANTMPVPLFAQLTCDPALYAPDNVGRFVAFIFNLRLRLHWDSEVQDNREWYMWLKLRHELNLQEQGLSIENLDSLTRELEKRPAQNASGADATPHCADLLRPFL